MSPFHAAYIAKLATEGVLSAVLPRGREVAEMEPYFYNATFEGLDVTPAQQQLIQTQADCDFILTGMSIATQLASGSINPSSYIYWQIRDTASGKTFFNEPMTSLVFAGGAGAPGWLAVPRLILANSNLLVSAQTYFVATQVRAWLSLSGVRVFYRS